MSCSHCVAMAPVPIDICYVSHNLQSILVAAISCGPQYTTVEDEAAAGADGVAQYQFGQQSSCQQLHWQCVIGN